MGGGGGGYLVHHPVHNFSPEVGGERLHGNGRLQCTLCYLQCYSMLFTMAKTIFKSED